MELRIFLTYLTRLGSSAKFSVRCQKKKERVLGQKNEEEKTDSQLTTLSLCLANGKTSFFHGLLKSG